MLLTGRHPQTTGQFHNSIRTRHTEISIADAFAHQVYRTGWVGKWHLHTANWPSNWAPDWVPEGREELYDLQSDPLEMRNCAQDPQYYTLRDQMRVLLLSLQTDRGDDLLPCESYRGWFDTQRRVVRSVYGSLNHPESEPDWSLLA